MLGDEEEDDHSEVIDNEETLLAQLDHLVEQIKSTHENFSIEEDDQNNNNSF